MMKNKKIVLFASGTGTNAVNIIKSFPSYEFWVFSNKSDAPVLENSKQLGAKVSYFTKSDWVGGAILSQLKEIEPDLVVLAGFLWLVPSTIVNCFPKKIVNIHPSLLPKYGGKGMFGMKVHQAVVENKEIETGITIHYVNEAYDEGEVILQATCKVLPEYSPEEVANNIHQLEYKHFPEVISGLLE